MNSKGLRECIVAGNLPESCDLKGEGQGSTISLGLYAVGSRRSPKKKTWSLLEVTAFIWVGNFWISKVKAVCWWKVRLNQF